jgi:hypothetical protein
VQVLGAADQQHDLGARLVQGCQHPETTLQHGVVLGGQVRLADDLGHQPRQAEAPRSRRGGPQHPTALPGQLRCRLVQQGMPFVAFDEQDSVAAGHGLIEQQAERLGPACRRDDADRVHDIPRTDDSGQMMAGRCCRRRRNPAVCNSPARERLRPGLSCCAS